MTNQEHEGGIFTTLRELPLMKGVSSSTLEQVVGCIPFHFLKYSEGQFITEAGDECTHLKFLISGSVRMEVAAADGQFRVLQSLRAPQVISPDYLFGRSTRYPATTTALDTVGIMQVAKEDYRSMLTMDPIFLFNYLNVISTGSQRSLHGVLSAASGSLETRLAFWIVSLTQPGSFDIELSCGRRALYSVLGVSRSRLATTLESLKTREIIDYDADGTIRVISRPALIEILASGLNPQ